MTMTSCDRVKNGAMRTPPCEGVIIYGIKTHQEIRDPEWPVTGISTPLIGGEPQEQGVKIRIYANYDGNY